ncbi:MAG: hypothetical protein MJZ36_11080 [Bacteroidaceae bacterium]|nr:hypothetical protein [Bacteroidaceae bacterium]
MKKLLFIATVAMTSVVATAQSTSGISTRADVTRVVPRLTVVEEFTGTGCGFCPRGWVGMEAVKNQKSDKAVVIAWHKFNSSDAMYTANYAKLDFEGAPQCTVDRKINTDPYAGDKKKNILEIVDSYNAEVPTVAVQVKGEFEDETNKQIKVSATTEFLTDTKGYTIAFAITADGLTGTTATWKQNNYYFDATREEVEEQAHPIYPEMPDIAKFISGGEWGTEQVALVYNDVLISSSYNQIGESLVPAFTKGKASDVETSEYVLKMPTKATLVKALDYNKIYVTAIVIDDKGNIANAARARVTGAGEVENPDQGGDTTPVEIAGVKVSERNDETQLMGEAMSPDATYVVGTNIAYYAPMVWNTTTGAVKNYTEYAEGAFHAVNNSGFAVGDDGQGEGQAIAFRADGTQLVLYHDEGEIKHNDEFDFDYSTGDAGSAAYAVSEDGKLIAGYYFASDYTTFPCIWNEKGERITLPLPTYEEAGFEISGGEVRWISTDGSILAGFLMDNMSTWPAAIWRKNSAGNYDCEIVSKPFWEEGYKQGKPYMVFTTRSLSPNGEWMSLQVQKEFDDWDFSTPQPLVQAARLNLKTGQLEVLDDNSGVGIDGSGIANDGTMVAYSLAEGLVGRLGYIWKAGEKKAICINDIFAQNPELPSFMANTPCSITADGTKIMGFGIDANTDIFSYVMSYSDGANGISTPAITVRPTDKIYNIAGQQMNSMNGRGIFIKNGKKMVK